MVKFSYLQRHLYLGVHALFDEDGSQIGGEACAGATTPPPPPQTPGDCDPAYPDVCIPSPPPDLDCGEITHRNFRVLAPDPHRFDGDGDGIGCES